uniref:Uncharacterized protein n=1 Tax=Oryza sativa subsp. japonica TaxID=39947 RepID=Q6ZI96_ORYSJ|nr:hypothetical protein [Oryza sativa Japonica Group]BAD09124.1 hypothetical protein [Oryza sativa Japonica Group]
MWQGLSANALGADTLHTLNRPMCDNELTVSLVVQRLYKGSAPNTLALRPCHVASRPPRWRDVSASPIGADMNNLSAKEVGAEPTAYF